MWFFFFFQAEDGIRDYKVTGVQTCALPIWLRRRAVVAAEAWVRAHQEADGSWGGIQPPWVWSILMLAALGHGFEDETLRRAVEGWQGFMVEEGDRLRPEAC